MSWNELETVLSHLKRLQLSKIFPIDILHFLTSPIAMISLSVVKDIFLNSVLLFFRFTVGYFIT